MARTVGGPSSAKKPTQGVSPAVAALVIVVVLVLVVALWLKFTSGPSRQGGSERGGLFSHGGKVVVPTTITPEQRKAAEAVQKGLLEGQRAATGK